ncbi:hypothetical protein A3860_39120 [Niastella vici]|uniref:DUF2279 domain-containing protein n=1 Tax=Niastella vici TaxID=1703345 RepID=A0A1V9FL42_9BACT|nr:DUF2279 domain-containing protein [Niastella vici]OQP58946.1 hypothetical protein A3860_39120 [Niastella vici]
MKKITLVISFFIVNSAIAQDSTFKPGIEVSFPASNINHKKIVVAGASFAGYTGSLYFLNKAWYKDYPKSSFHTFDDNSEWLQIDKVGHLWTAYNTSRLLYVLWKWAGCTSNESVLIGTLSGFSYMTVIEFLDAHSAKWGWSWGDISANFAGSSIFLVQQLAWKEQKLQIKFSSHKVLYSNELLARANDLYGKSLAERLLKDYNAQTYWMSFSLARIFRNRKLPGWLNIAIGYGAEGMFGANENIGFDKNGQITFNRTDIKRFRQWYLAPDIDLTKIKSKNKIIQSLFTALNSIKFPAPSIEFSNNRIRGHWLHF